jgi:ATP synthase protein I
MKRPEHSAPEDNLEDHKEFRKQVKVKTTRKVKAQREKDYSIFFGLGMIGLVGWSIALPTIIGIAIGVWIDTKFPSRYSWTLMLLFIGVILGCLNAWFWIQQESRED